MDFKFTFTNGSEALVHHGTKGMKWGVWNAETRARRQGIRAAKREASLYKGPDSKAKRFGKNVLKEQARFDVPVSVLKGAIAGGITGNPLVGLAVGGVSYGVWSTMTLAGNGVAIARGKKTYWDKVDETTQAIKATKTQKTGAKNERLAEIQEAEKRKGKSAVSEVLSDEPKWKQNGYSSEKEHREAIDAAAKYLEKKDGGKVVSTYYDKPDSSSNVKQVRQQAVKTKEYRQGAKEGYELLTKGFDVDRSSAASRAQVAKARNNLADLANKEISKGNRAGALNAMAKAETFDAWLNSKDDADFKRRINM